MEIQFEIEDFLKTSWGIATIASWGTLLVFTLVDMIIAWVRTATLASYAFIGVFDLLILGSSAVFIFAPYLSEKLSLDKNLTYKISSFIPFGLLYLIAIIAGRIILLVLIWSYFIQFIASIGVFVCIYMFLKKEDVQLETPQETGDENLTEED